LAAAVVMLTGSGNILEILGERRRRDERRK
jgi:hypothetical protein